MKKIFGLLLSLGLATPLCAVNEWDNDRDNRHEKRSGDKKPDGQRYYDEEESDEDSQGEDKLVDTDNCVNAIIIGAVSGLIGSEMIITVADPKRFPGIPGPIKGIAALGLVYALSQGRMDMVQQLLGKKYVGLSTFTALAIGVLRLAHYQGN